MAFFSFAILFLSYQTIRNYSTDPLHPVNNSKNILSIIEKKIGFSDRCTFLPMLSYPWMILLGLTLSTIYAFVFG